MTGQATWGGGRGDGSLRLVDVSERLAALHCEFERIHPFLDGNGRTSRLALNLVLVRLGWPPVVILRSQRLRYLSGLDRADHGGTGPLGELLARAIIASIHRLLPHISDQDDLLPLSALADADASAAALKQAAIRGRLEAIRDISGRWLASPSAVQRSTKPLGIGAPEGGRKSKRQINITRHWPLATRPFRTQTTPLTVDLDTSLD